MHSDALRRYVPLCQSLACAPSLFLPVFERFCIRCVAKLKRDYPAPMQVMQSKQRPKRVAIRGKIRKDGVHAIVQQRLMEIFDTPMDAFVFLGKRSHNIAKNNFSTSCQFMEINIVSRACVQCTVQV